MQGSCPFWWSEQLSVNSAGARENPVTAMQLSTQYVSQQVFCSSGRAPGDATGPRLSVLSIFLHQRHFCRWKPAVACRPTAVGRGNRSLARREFAGLYVFCLPLDDELLAGAWVCLGVWQLGECRDYCRACAVCCGRHIPVIFVSNYPKSLAQTTIRSECISLFPAFQNCPESLSMDSVTVCKPQSIFETFATHACVYI